MTTNLDGFERHQLGHFWPHENRKPSLSNAAERGLLFIRDGWVQLETLDDDPESTFNQRPRQRNVLGIPGRATESEVLLLEVFGTGFSTVMGEKASSFRYTARTLVEDAPIEALRGFDPLALRVPFLGIQDWARIADVKAGRIATANGEQRWAVSMEPPPDLTVSLSKKRCFTMSTELTIKKTAQDTTSVGTPVTVACSADKPMDIWEFLSPLIQFQELIGLAYEGFVPAGDGGIALDVNAEMVRQYRKEPTFWNGALMHLPERAHQPESMSEFPLFYMGEIGGLDGVANWIRLCDKHDRATNPVTAPIRRGYVSDESALIDIAVGIEYWVKANAEQFPSAKWCRPPQRPNTRHGRKQRRQTSWSFALALAQRVGTPFARWVGDVERWSEDFWNVYYNGLKHRPKQLFDPTYLAELERSARLLLTASLLNRAASSTVPSQAVFGSHRAMHLGQRLRKRYGTP